MTKRLYVATRKGLFTLDRNGSGAQPWRITQVDHLAEPVVIVTPDERHDRVYAAVSHGHFGNKLHRSNDGGRTWEEAGTPTYPPKPDDAPVIKDPIHQQEVPWSLYEIWALEPSLADQPGVLWCGTIPGGLFKSEDHGATWSLVESLWNEPKRAQWFGGGKDYPGIHSIFVDPKDANHVWVAISCGGVWETRDGGDTWSNDNKGMFNEYSPPEHRENPAIQDPHRMVGCPSNPNVFWIQHHNGVFKSVDGAKTWTEVANAAPSNFGFAVAVHPKEPQTAWFAPAQKDMNRVPVDAKLVISRTRDGGEHFDVLSEGLPQEHAYDITYRHALDLDDAGDCLAFGTTTGNLFISEDQGESWTCISNHMPPVYCVRFVKPK